LMLTAREEMASREGSGTGVLGFGDLAIDPGPRRTWVGATPQAACHSRYPRVQYHRLRPADRSSGDCCAGGELWVWWTR